MGSLSIINAIFLIGFISGSCFEFKNYHLIRISPKNHAEIDLVGSWQNNLDFDVWNVKIDFIDVLLSPVAFNKYKELLEDNLIEYKILNQDIQRNIDEETRSIKLKALEPGSERVVGTFASHAGINNWLNSLALSNAQFVSTYSIGKTAENRELRVIRLNKATTTKKKIWIDCGIHAREWISPATCVWMINSLVQGSNNGDADVKSVLDYFDIHILPVHNPDGYDYTQSSSANRLWRKNRAINQGSSCIGVDLNRNYGYKWMVAGASDNPCSDLYAGPAGDSELETKAVENAINNYIGEWSAFFTIHTYGQYWFTPWGFTSDLPDDYKDLVDKSNIAVAAIKAVNGSVFQVGSSTNLLYAAAGGSDDWAKGVAGIKYSHCLELRPGNSGTDSAYGFTLPVDRVPAAGTETYRGVIEFLKAIKN